MIAIGNFLFRFRNALFPVLYLLLFLSGERLFSDPMVAALVGAAVAVAGQMIRCVTIGLDYIVRGGLGGKVYADDLVVTGLYHHTRNPMYVGNVLIAAGLSLASNSWTAVAAAIPLSVFVYIAIVAAEEEYLRGKFGEAFERYCIEVPRWLPRLNGLVGMLMHGGFHWRRMIVKEYGTPVGWILVLCGLALLNLRREGFWVERAESVSVILMTAVVSAVLWMLVRFLKKSRRLMAD